MIGWRGRSISPRSSNSRGSSVQTATFMSLSSVLKLRGGVNCCIERADYHGVTVLRTGINRAAFLCLLLVQLFGIVMLVTRCLFVLGLLLVQRCYEQRLAASHLHLIRVAIVDYRGL